MIKQIRASYFVNFKNAQYCALSTDPIPDYLENGDEVYMIDTGKNYFWDASSSSLIEQPTGGGGSGGTTNYNQLSNKPKINNVELIGNKTLEALGINAGTIGFDETEIYTDGSVGKELSAQKNAISQKQDATSYVTLSGTIVTQTGVDNTMYLCGELTELTFTAPATGQTAIRFTSGTTPTVATFTGVTWLNGFDPSAIESSKTYEVNILNGLGCAAWT